MVKKLIVMLGILLLSITSICHAYTDVDDHWAKESVDSLNKINIIQGYEDNTFRPDDYITRAEFVTIVNRILKNEKMSNRYIVDNNSRDWYYNEIKKAVASRILDGDADGKMRPNDFITREEAIVVLHRAFSGEKTDNLKIKNYADYGNVSQWAMNAFAVFVKNGYIKGYEDNTLHPESAITRAESITIIDRLFSEIVIKGKYSENIYGNLLINGQDVEIENTYVEGDLIITEGTNGSVKLKNIIVAGNLVMRTSMELPSKNFDIRGEVVELYNGENDSKSHTYSNEKYGISFTIPDKAKVIELVDGKESINYKTKNLIIVKFECDENTLYKSFSLAEKEIENNYANLYERISYKRQGTVETGYYYDKKENVHLVLIKRDEVIYTIMIYNADNENVPDNLLNSIEMFDSEFVKTHEIKTYKNKKLFLEFSYIDYIGVDDSYNTNIICENSKDFMLYIQVTTITDMERYSIEQLKYMFDSIVNEEGKMINSEIKKVYRYDAVDYTIDMDEKLNRSLYVVADSKLYKFIFTGDKSKMESIGNDLFDYIENSIEM